MKVDLKSLLAMAWIEDGEIKCISQVCKKSKKKCPNAGKCSMVMVDLTTVREKRQVV